MPPQIVRYPPIQCNTRERYDQLQIPAVPPAWRVPEGPDSLAAVPMGGGRAWPGFEGKLHHTQRHKRRQCGGRRRVRRARLRCPWAAAGPGRASLSDTSTAGAEGVGGSGGPGCGARGRRRGLAGQVSATQAPPVRRAPEGPEGQGGLRDRPLRAEGSRVAISRAAGPEGAQNTSGATNNNERRRWLPARTARGRRGLAGLRGDAPSEARGADGSRAGRRPRAH